MKKNAEAGMKREKKIVMFFSENSASLYEAMIAMLKAHARRYMGL